MHLFRSIILVILFATLCAASNPSLPQHVDRLHVCTVASHTSPNLEKLIASCNHNGIRLEILGLDQPYRNNLDKLLIMKDCCHRLPDDDLVLFVDAFDVLILADKNEILSRFLPMEVPMLMSTEINCWPIEIAKSAHPLTSSPFKYINTGGYIGWVWAIRNWLDAFDETLLEGTSDQAATHKLFLQNPTFFALDHKCTLFLSLYLVSSDSLILNAFHRNIYCKPTQSSPCILHANGQSFEFWDQVYSSFFEPLKKRQSP